MELAYFENAYIKIGIAKKFGPRILHFGLIDSPNLFGIHPDIKENTDWGTWQAYGGHRLWCSPETKPFTYDPDNDPVEIEESNQQIVISGSPSSHTGLKKTLLLTLSKNQLTVHHVIKNCGETAHTLAPWALTIMAPEGEILIPQEPFQNHGDSYLPARPLTLWPYTNLNDPRIHFDRDLITIKNDSKNNQAFKIGFGNFQGWAAYKINDTLFIKQFPPQAGEGWPDYGVNSEFFTSESFIEMETLGPLATLKPGEQVEHKENWLAIHQKDLPHVEKDLRNFIENLM